MKIAYIIISLLLLNFHSFASSGKEGHGGHGVLENDQIYLLDLYVSGNHRNPKITFNFLNSNIKELIDERFENLNIETKSLIVAKLSEIFEVEPYFSIAIVEAIKQFSWYFIDHELHNVVIESSTANLEHLEIFQVAIRSGKSIFIKQDYWEKMDDANKAALIIHEAISATQTPQIINNELELDPSHVRELVAYLFGHKVERLSLRRILEYGFPFPKRFMLMGYGEAIYANPVIQLNVGYSAQYIDPRLNRVSEYCQENELHYFLKLKVIEVNFFFNEIYLNNKKTYFLKPVETVKVLKNNFINLVNSSHCSKRISEELVKLNRFLYQRFNFVYKMPQK